MYYSTYIQQQSLYQTGFFFLNPNYRELLKFYKFYIYIYIFLLMGTRSYKVCAAAHTDIYSGTAPV